MELLQATFPVAIDLAQVTDILENKTRKLVLDPPSYQNLSPKNQRALTHLIRVAQILDDVFLQQDHPQNIHVKQVLKNLTPQDENISKLYTLFSMFNGVQGSDLYAQITTPLVLFSGITLSDGKGFYPQDITVDELVEYILAYPEQASAIFSNNTMVVRSGPSLISAPYSVVFKNEYQAAAKELLLAASETDHAGLAKYLRYQAQALVNDSDPAIVYNAETSWIDLEDSPLEFTISRECYDDRLSGDVAADPRVKQVLDANGIIVKSKDSIGIRVGIVNAESVEIIAGYRKQLEGYSKTMPLCDQYPSRVDGSAKMTFADVDLVALTGDYAAIRGGVTSAQNLPNSDKLSSQLKYGSRMVFHRQIRLTVDELFKERYLNMFADSFQRSWYNNDADFMFTIGHELSHSLGPTVTTDGRDKVSSLGNYGSILEENKADVSSIVMTDYFVGIGKFSLEQANQIYFTWMLDSLPDKQPSLDEAHRTREVMQVNYFIERGAVEFNVGKTLSIVPAKFPIVASSMLTEIIQLQLDGNSANAETFVKKYSAWNDYLQYSADKMSTLGMKKYKMLVQPLLATF